MEKKIEYKKWTSNQNEQNKKTKTVSNRSHAKKDPKKYSSDQLKESAQSVKNKKTHPMNAKNKKVSKEKKVRTPEESKRKKRTIRLIVIFVILLLVGVGIYLLCTLPTFDIKSFSVKGITKYQEQEIIEKSGLEINQNTFLSLFKGASKKITELPYVEHVKITLTLPNQINFAITERTSVYFAFDKEKNQFFRLDKDGYILEASDINAKTPEELLTFGITFNDEVVLGEQINEIDLSKLYVYTHIQNEFEQSGINGKITKVNFENSLTTITLNDKLNVVLPNDTNIKYNMAFLNGIIQKIGEDKVGVIDMTKSKPTFSSF